MRRVVKGVAAGKERDTGEKEREICSWNVDHSTTSSLRKSHLQDTLKLGQIHVLGIAILVHDAPADSAPKGMPKQC